MDWFFVDMTDVSLTNGEYHRLCREFQKAFIAHGAPSDMALFAETLLRNNVRRVFCSPGSLAFIPGLIEQFEFQLCNGPDPGTVTLVFGVPGAESTLLPRLVTWTPGDGSGTTDVTIHPVNRNNPLTASLLSTP